MAAAKTSSLQHNLLITSPNTIHLHSLSTTRPLFECANASGIVSAKAARDNSGLLAIADSHLINTTSTLLKVANKADSDTQQGPPRILLFTPDSKTLIFTTSLSNAIQAYSIPTAELLPPLNPHPSPPKVIAVSSDGSILLSASTKPPWILLQDLRTVDALACPLRPAASEAAASCAAFQHPEPEDRPASLPHFLIGFRDGTLALYLLGIPRLHEPAEAVPASRLSPHNVQLHPPTELHSYRRLHKPSMGGIAAADFLPGHRSRVVSVGHDGRCRLVDFTKGGEVLRTWYVSNPPTCLSVVPTRPPKRRGRSEKTMVGPSDTGEDNQRLYEVVETLIAIGTQAGNVLVFNVLGLLVHEVLLELPIIGVEWVGDMSAPCRLPKPRDMSRCADQEFVRGCQPVLNSYIGDFDGLEENKCASDTGTVRHTKLSPISTPSVSPGPYVQPKNSTSPAFTLKIPATGGPDRSRNFNGSPGPALRTGKKRSMSHPRVPIAAETFGTPHKPLSAIHSSNVFTPIRASGSSRPASKDPVRAKLPKTGKRRRIPAVQVVSPVTGVNISGTAYVRPAELSSDTENNKVFFTPPTSRPRSAATLRSVLSMNVQPESSRRYSFSKAANVIQPGLTKLPSRKVAFLDISQSSTPSPLKQLKRKGSKIMSIAGITKDRRSGSREDLVLPRGGSPEIRDYGPKDTQMVKLLKDNAALKSELQALRTEMHVMRDLLVARRDRNVPG